MRATLELLAAPDTSLREIIVGELIAFNQDVLAPGLHIEPLAIVLRDETSEAVLGGLWGRTGWVGSPSNWSSFPKPCGARGSADR